MPAEPSIQSVLGFSTLTALAAGPPITVSSAPQPGAVPVGVFALSTERVGQMIWHAAQALAERKGGRADDHIEDAQSVLYAVGLEPRDELI